MKNWKSKAVVTQNGIRIKTYKFNPIEKNCIDEIITNNEIAKGNPNRKR
jgi:hypothetical protein